MGGRHPRWYGAIHAGKLLLAFGEEQAIPLFENILRDQDHDVLLEWFDTDLPALGPPFVPTLIDVMRDASVYSYGRNLSIDALGTIAHEHPEERERIVDALRARLPLISAQGKLEIDRQVIGEQVEHWTRVALELAELQDEESRSRIEGLFRAGLIDEFVVGDIHDYRAILTAEEDPKDEFSLDLPGQYDRRRRLAAVREAERASAYDDLEDGELLTALEMAGYGPDPALIRACLPRREALTPTLLDWVEESLDPEHAAAWSEDNPRWYRRIHAAHLLVAFGEEKALPLFEEHIRRQVDDTLVESLADKLHFYGPAAAPMLSGLVEDEEAPVWKRELAVQELESIARAHPPERDRIVSLLRSHLPALDEAGRVASAETADEEEVRLWSSLAHHLAWLQDEESRPVVEALLAQDLVDEWLLADVDEYRSILRSDVAEAEAEGYDIVSDYEDWHRRAQIERQPTEWEPSEAASTGDGHYVDGGTFVRDEAKVGRNDPCPCGSGKKYKRCCGP